MKLSDIQAQLKVPKNNRNDFGKYNYRSAEDIIEAVKKIINPQGLSLIISDTIIEVGGRIYVKSTASISDDAHLSSDGESCNVFYSAIGWAREDETIKGMSAAQVTGSASSYARKYALNGLLAIDDTKDADATNDNKVETTPIKLTSSRSLSKERLENACKLIAAGDKKLYQKTIDSFDLEPSQIKQLLEAFAEPISKQLNGK